jgi:uncharacterized membrane protein YeaQ/YmgE (transglycosylase-associated protein family)
MDWLVTIVVGGIVGWLGSMVAGTNAKMGLIANVLVGILGSALGFWLAGVLGFAAYGIVARWVVAVAGAAILIALLKMVGFFK